MSNLATVKDLRRYEQPMLKNYIIFVLLFPGVLMGVHHQQLALFINFENQLVNKMRLRKINICR